jgi:hypothetical protein
MIIYSLDKGEEKVRRLSLLCAPIVNVILYTDKAVVHAISLLLVQLVNYLLMISAAAFTRHGGFNTSTSARLLRLCFLIHELDQHPGRLKGFVEVLIRLKAIYFRI